MPHFLIIQIAADLGAVGLLGFLDLEFVIRQFPAEPQHFLVAIAADDARFFQEGLADGDGGVDVVDGVERRSSVFHVGVPSFRLLLALSFFKALVASLNLVTIV